MNAPRRILQIIPSDGWNALYAIRPERQKKNPVWVAPLACWALVQQEMVRYVVGLDCTLSFCDQGDNFLGYLAPGMKPDMWKEKALRNLQNPKSNGPDSGVDYP
jgi:hypothetical protein